MPPGALSTDLTTLMNQWLVMLRAGSTQGFLADVQSGAFGTSSPVQSVTVQGPGSAGSPAITIGGSNNGLYQVGTNNLGEAINGTLIFDWSATRVKFAQPIQAPDGTTAAPSITFSAQSTTGLSRPGSGMIDISAANYASGASPFVRFSSALGVIIGNSMDLGFTGSSGAAGTVDTVLARGSAAQQLVFGGITAVAGGATTSTTFLKNYSAIADNVATATMTITIPNAAHSASLWVQIAGSLGAGGAIGANEATGSVGYLLSVTRTAGVNAVGTTSTAFGSANASVAGAATITTTAGLSSVSGAVGASNSFTLNVTIARGSGSSTNHTAVVQAVLLNANTTGITLS